MRRATTPTQVIPTSPSRISNVTIVSSVRPLPQRHRAVYSFRSTSRQTCDFTLRSVHLGNDIVITALHAVHRTKTAWEAVTLSTIRNTFRAANFVSATTDDTTNDDEESEEQTMTGELSTALQALDFVAYTCVHRWTMYFSYRVRRIRC